MTINKQSKIQPSCRPLRGSNWCMFALLFSVPGTKFVEPYGV